MADLFASGRIIDIVMAIVAIEAILLLSIRHKLQLRLAAVDIAMILAPGLCLMLALRAALSSAGWETVAGWLIAAFVTHLADLARRVTRG